MTKTARIFIVGLTGFVLLSTTAVAQAVAPNLIANPSLEVVNSEDPTLPDQWSVGGYGNNDRVHTYPVPGMSDGVAAQIAITSYTDGDGKWYFNDVLVAPGNQYYFQDYYKADVPTEIVVRYTNGSAVETYQSIASLSPAVDWQAGIGSFTPPAETVSATVFHLLSQAGTLTVDEFALVMQSPPVITDNVPNNSAEESIAVNANYPLAWSQFGYGQKTVNFEYSSEAHDGAKGLKLTVSDYVSGDAKWMYQPQAMTPGDYKFSAWYKTNVSPKVVAQFTRSDNSVYFFGMPNPEPSNEDWQQYVSEFSVPSDAVSVSVFFYLNSNGWLVTDDYHVTPYSYTGFSEGVVTLTFDDGVHVNVGTALPVLDSYGFKTTHCYMSEPVEGVPELITGIQAFIASGHEICSHSVTHPFLTQQTPEQREYELTHSQTVLQEITGGPVTTFTSPYGDYNSAVIEQIKSYYSAHRTVNEGFNSKDNLDIYRLRVQNMLPTTTLSEFQGWINKAIADKLWLILVYHKIDTANLEDYDTYLSDFNNQMEWLSTAGVQVKRLDHAVADLTAPVITNEVVSVPTINSMTVAWQTDHPATSRVVYDTVSHSELGEAPNYGYANSTTEDSTLVVDHSIIVNNLLPSTTYYFRTISHGSPERVSSELTGSTLAQPTDLCPNLDGNQSEIPSGYTLVEGQCIQQTPPCTENCGGGGGSSSGGGGGGSPIADLSLIKTVVGGDPTSTGTTFTYTLSVGNTGPSNATNVVVTDSLPASVNYVSSTASQGSYDNTTGKWAVGSLAVGSSATLQIVVNLVSGGTITNFASSISSENDLNVSNNTSTYTFTLGNVAGATTDDSKAAGGPTPEVLGVTDSSLPRTGGMPIQGMLYFSWLAPLLERFRARKLKE